MAQRVARMLGRHSKSRAGWPRGGWVLTGYQPGRGLHHQSARLVTARHRRVRTSQQPGPATPGKPSNTTCSPYTTSKGIEFSFAGGVCFSLPCRDRWWAARRADRRWQNWGQRAALPWAPLRIAYPLDNWRYGLTATLEGPCPAGVSSPLRADQPYVLCSRHVLREEKPVPHR